MNSEIRQIWLEVLQDFGSQHIFWQIVVLLAAFGVAWLVNDMLRAYVMRHAHESTKLAIGGINRVLFPLSVLIGVGLGKWLLMGWQHTGMLQITIKLLLVLALIRLSVYALRYIFDPSGWLKAFERMIAWVIWGVLALHFTGDLPRIINALESVQFTLGKSRANLWMLLQGLFTIVVTLFVTLWLSRLIENKLMRVEQLTPNIRVVLGKLVRIFFIVIGVLFALSAAGLDITLLSVFGGALGVGLGFGLQRIASNYVSGFIILLDKSMQIGDMVSVDKHHGIIQDMRSRYMVLAKQDGTNVIIPNEVLITSAVVNYSSEHTDRVQVNVCVGYGSPLELAMRLMQQAAAKQERVLKTPAPEVIVKGFVEQGAELVLNVWVADPEKPIAPLQSALYLEIWKAFRVEEIRMAKPETKPNP